MFLLNQYTTVTSASGTVETLYVGNTYITVGYDGYHILEIPGLGLQPDNRTPTLPIYEENQLLYGKLYRISQDRSVKTHPALRLYHRPLLAFNDLLTRSVDRYLPSRTCYVTKVKIPFLRLKINLVKWPVCWDLEALTGNPEEDHLVKSYDSYVQAFNQKRLGVYKFGPFDQLKTRRIFDLNERFDLPTIDLAKKWQLQSRILEDEKDAFVRHI